jgi:protein involved in polysaccharide export with SLBB domain
VKDLYSALLLACCILAGGCATKQTTAVEANQNEVLRPGDTIFAYATDQESPASPFPGFQIDDHGTATLPLVGPIEFAGLTSAQAAKKIRDAYVPKYYAEVEVVVRKVDSVKR